ncbi:MAG: hypothetical protein ABFE07_28350 [Armatimonadia bacterium]
MYTGYAEDDPKTAEALVTQRTWRQRLWCLYGWLLVRPRRWAFRHMVFSERPRGFRRGWEGDLIWPNYGWWLLYATVFRALSWFFWNGYWKLCPRDSTGKVVRHPWYARALRRIAETTAGAAAHGGECWHCASKDGDPVDLNDDDTGRTFILLDAGSTGTPDGTDHWFRGVTICPRCGYRQEYGDGSL